MSITALHIPYSEEGVSAVRVNERNAMSYYPYVQGGPVEAAQIHLAGVDVAVYVNSRYAQLDASRVNGRASALFRMAGIGMFGGAIRGDALVVLAAGDRDYEQSLPRELLEMFLEADEGMRRDTNAAD